MKFSINEPNIVEGMHINNLLESLNRCKKVWPDCYVVSRGGELYLYNVIDDKNSELLYQILFDHV